MTTEVLQSASPDQIAEQVSNARAMEIIQGAGMVVPKSVAEIEAISPFAQSFGRRRTEDAFWINKDPLTGQIEDVPPALYPGFLKTAETLGDVSFWSIDSEDTGMDAIRKDENLQHLHEYAEQRIALAEKIREHEQAERLQVVHEKLAARDALYGLDENGKRTSSSVRPLQEVQDIDMSVLVARPYSEPERVEVASAKRSKIAQFFSGLVRRVLF